MAETPCNSQYVIVTAKKNIQALRKKLEEINAFDDAFSVTSVGDKTALPLKEKTLCSLIVPFELLEEINGTMSDISSIIESVDGKVFSYHEIDCYLTHMKCNLSKKSRVKTKYMELIEHLGEFLACNGIDITEKLKQDIPDHWEMHGDLILLPEKFFTNAVWYKYGSVTWETVAKALCCKRVAKKSVITSDGFRTPQVDILLGDNGWVKHIDNGIRYKYDVTKCMFSAGNISEKLRVASFDCKGKTVVDLYAGIGYFTLPYLVHAKADFVHACEWNPDAVDALELNLLENGVADRCKIYHGDNRKVCPVNVADEVNLGLIPSSNEGWIVACKALKTEVGGILHIHDNVTSSSQHSEKTNGNLLEVINDQDLCFCAGEFIEEMKKMKKIEWLQWAVETAKQIRTILRELHSNQWDTQILHVENLKSYAPHINNLVLDLECRPKDVNK